MAEALTVSFKNVADESIVNRDQTVTKVRRYDFFIGKYGPFTERVPLEGFTESEIDQRIARLKSHLGSIGG